MKKIIIGTSGLSSTGQKGGIASYVHDLAENLVDNGYLVTVFLIKEDYAALTQNIKYDFKLFEVGQTVQAEEETIIEILYAIKSLKPDIIINNDTSYIAGLWPVISSDIVKISVVHGFSKSFTLTNAGIMGKIATLNAEYIDYIVCQNSRMTIDVAAKYKVPTEKVVFIPQASDYIQFENKPDSEIFTITFAGGANKKKGAVEMLEISKLLKNSSLKFKVNWCLSAGKYKSHFSDDNRFHFLGNLSRDQFVRTLKASDCIIIPTHLDTGPLLLVEAMGQAVIPICNNLMESAIPDIISSGHNGILISNNNPNLFFAEISHLISNREYREQLKRHTYDYFRQNLTKQNQIERFETLFSEKKAGKNKVEFSSRNVIYFHRKNTSNLPKYSPQRIKCKILNALEIPQYKA